MSDNYNDIGLFFTQGTAVIYVGLILFEDLPYKMTLVGLFSLFIYSLMLKNFPFIELTSVSFVASCGMNCLC